MTNNDIIRRLRYIFDLNDSDVINLFALANHEVTREQVCNWLKNDDDPAFVSLNDLHFATFLNGFIISKRGKKEGDSPKPEKRLNNNIIFRKLKIALNLKDEDILAIYDLTDIQLSKHELSAFFRGPEQSQYRLCNDQYLRNFLTGLQIKIKNK